MLADRGRLLLVSFTLYVVSNSVLVRSLCSSVWKKNQHFCKNAPRNGRSPVSELPHCGLQAFPVSVALLHRVFGPLRWVGSFVHSFRHVAENDSQAIAPGFVDGLLWRFYAFLSTSVYWQVSGTSAFLLPFLVLPASSKVDVLLALLLLKNSFVERLA